MLDETKTKGRINQVLSWNWPQIIIISCGIISWFSTFYGAQMITDFIDITFAKYTIAAFSALVIHLSIWYFLSDEFTPKSSDVNSQVRFSTNYSVVALMLLIPTSISLSLMGYEQAYLNKRKNDFLDRIKESKTYDSEVSISSIQAEFSATKVKIEDEINKNINQLKNNNNLDLNSINDALNNYNISKSELQRIQEDYRNLTTSSPAIPLATQPSQNKIDTPAIKSENANNDLKEIKNMYDAKAESEKAEAELKRQAATLIKRHNSELNRLNAKKESLQNDLRQLQQEHNIIDNGKDPAYSQKAQQYQANNTKQSKLIISLANLNVIRIGETNKITELEKNLDDVSTEIATHLSSLKQLSQDYEKIEEIKTPRLTFGDSLENLKEMIVPSDKDDSLPFFMFLFAIIFDIIPIFITIRQRIISTEHYSSENLLKTSREFLHNSLDEISKLNLINKTSGAIRGFLFDNRTLPEQFILSLNETLGFDYQKFKSEEGSSSTPNNFTSTVIFKILLGTTIIILSIILLPKAIQLISNTSLFSNPNNQ